MRRVAITAPFRADVQDAPLPEPRPGEAVVEVAFCGVCGTDYHFFRGDLDSEYPLVGGHEASGVIVSVGAGVKSWQPGDRVAIDPTLTCNRCYHCLRREFNQCDNWQAIGDAEPGAFAEFVRAPIANIFRVEDHESLDTAALTEPLACVVWGVTRLNLQPADRVLVFGSGPIGGLLTQMLSKSGPASDIVVVDVMDEKLEIARTMGATATYISGPDLGAELKERTKGRGFDAVVDCTGVASVIEGMFGHVAPRGKVMIFGVTDPKDVVRISPYDIYRRDITVVGSMAINFTFQQARELLASGRINVRPLISTVAGLSDLPNILGRPKRSTELKTLISPSAG